MESVGWAGGECSSGQAVDGLRDLYSLVMDGEIELLDHLQWADWDPKGRLLVATRSGRLQIRRLDNRHGPPEFDLDLSPIQPQALPTPGWATRW